MGQSRPLFFIFVFSIQLTVNVQYINFADDWIRTMDAWELEATALPTEPQPLPISS